MTGRLRVLSHLGDADASGIPHELRSRVEVVSVPTRGPVPPEVEGEVLLCVPWAGDTVDELLERGVRWVHVCGTGIDELPLRRLAPGLTLTNSRGASAVPVAEWTLAMMLAFEKRLPESWIDRPPRRWRHDPGLGTLEGRMLALVGLGGIGTATARRALAFGMRVRALRRTERPAPEPGVELAADLSDLVGDADHLVLAAPLTPATERLIDAAALSSVKPGVHLVNVARGRLVDHDALRAALDDGRVACASLDAVDPEPLPAGHWLYAYPRVRLSPHISWGAPGALPAILGAFVDNLRRYLDGLALESVVDPVAGY